MRPYYRDKGITIYHGNCREVVREIDRTYTAVVTDPPYGLKFMGKEWDHGVPSPSTWRRIARFLAPGAPLLVFGGTRTFHRLAVNLEDAELELRDTLMWLYGSGFPKSMDVSKAIDKGSSAPRRVIGTARGRGSNSGGSRYNWNNPNDKKDRRFYEVTEAATALAQQFTGYGTALKPAWEPILLAMRSTDGTFADNARKHGVAGLNVDAARIGTPFPAAKRRATARKTGNTPTHHGKSARDSEALGLIHNRARPEVYAAERPSEQLGRWPANLLLDETSAAMLDAQSGKRRASGLYPSDAKTFSSGASSAAPQRSPVSGRPLALHSQWPLPAGLLLNGE